MSSLSPIQSQLKAFAASNSAGGFVCYYDAIFPPEKFDRLYVIKGGPGTGKSYFMQKVAAEAEQRGYTVEYFYCSSDPMSLDAIAAYPTTDPRARYGPKPVPKSFAVLDGTAPHVRDTLLPGAADEIVDLGNFWNTGQLVAKRGEIARLCGQKAEYFRRAYEYLEAAGELATQIKRLVLPAVNHEKMRAALSRIFKTVKPGGGHFAAPRPQAAISMAGRAAFDTFRQGAMRHYYVSECVDAAYLLFDEILKLAGEKKLIAVYSPSPLSPKVLDGVCLPEAGLAFTLCEGRPKLAENEKIINMARFVDLQKLSDTRGRLRLSRKYRDVLVRSAFECLADARRAHFALEKIYIAAMDFAKKEAATERYLDKILSL